MKIISIDPGTRNCGVCVWEDGAITHFGSYDLFDFVSKSKRTDYPLMARNFVDRTDLFDGVDMVLVEDQIQARMKMLACSWRCFFWDKSQRVSPLAVRNYFKIGHGNYKKNKASSKEFVLQFLSKSQCKELDKHRKKDDIADAVIQLFWYLKKNKL